MERTHTITQQEINTARDAVEIAAAELSHAELVYNRAKTRFAIACAIYRGNQKEERL